MRDLRVIPGGDRGPMSRFASALARDGSAERKPGRRAVVASVALHLVLVLGLVVGGYFRDPPVPPLIVYRVEMFSPPPAEQGEMPEVPTRTPEPPRVMEQRPEPAPPEVRQVTPPPPPPPPDPEPEPEPEEPEPPRGPDPVPETRVAGENLDIRIQGEEFPYPEYLENIIRQVRRYFGAWRGTPGLSAEVYFVIRRDGSVEGIRTLRRSGDFRFDLQAEGAVEAAGRNGAFGPLPSGYQADALRVAIELRP